MGRRRRSFTSLVIAAFVALVALVAVAAAGSVWTAQRIRAAVNEMVEEAQPRTHDARRFSREVNAYTLTALRLTQARSTAERHRLKEDLEQHDAELSKLVRRPNLKAQAWETTLRELRANAKQLIKLLDERDRVDATFDQAVTEARERAESLRRSVGPVLVDTFSELLSQPQARRQSVFEVENLRELESRALSMLDLLKLLPLQTDPADVKSTARQFNLSLRATVRRLDSAALSDRAIQLGRLLDLASSSESVFEQRLRQLQLKQQLQAALERAGELSQDIQRRAQTLDHEAAQIEKKASNTAAEAVATGNIVSVVLAIASLALAGFVGWYYVGNVIARRLNNLTKATLRLAGGELETPIRDDGDDELSTMAEAIEGFRQNALQLKESRQTLSRRNEELEQFAFAASHDLQEPLRQIRSYVELLQDDLGSKLREQDRLHMQFVVKASQRMSQLIRGLLDFSRAGEGTLEVEDVDLEQEYQRLRELFAPTLSADNARLQSKGLPTVNASPLIAQVLQNLVSNALKFCPEERNPLVQLSAVANDTETAVSVKDNGIGIEQRHQERIFQTFRQLNAPNEYEGIGMGLSISKRIVERHGGKISLTSVVGEGTTFTFTVPHRPPSESHPETTNAAREAKPDPVSGSTAA